MLSESKVKETLGQFTTGRWPNDLESKAYRDGIISTLKFILEINETLPYFRELSPPRSGEEGQARRKDPITHTQGAWN